VLLRGNFIEKHCRCTLLLIVSQLADDQLAHCVAQILLTSSPDTISSSNKKPIILMICCCQVVSEYKYSPSSSSKIALHDQLWKSLRLHSSYLHGFKWTLVIYLCSFSLLAYLLRPYFSTPTVITFGVSFELLLFLTSNVKFLPASEALRVYFLLCCCCCCYCSC
jgi:hypothetical protein